jgi:hypothetical protein
VKNVKYTLQKNPSRIGDYEQRILGERGNSFEQKKNHNFEDKQKKPISTLFLALSKRYLRF